MCDDMHDEEEASEPSFRRLDQRRGFLKWFFLFVVAAVIYPLRKLRAGKMALPMEKAPDLQTVGNSVLLKIKEQEVLFVRDTETTVRALNPICTHKKCKVAFKTDTGKLHCKCHKSAYDLLTGQVLAGPAPKPLQIYESKLDNNRIIFTIPDAAP